MLCVEERWLGKTHLEHRAFLQKNLLLNRKHQEIYDNAIAAMDEFAWGRKGSLGLLSTCRSPEELREEEAKLWRYVDTAERRLNAGKPRDLFEDEVSPSGAEEAPAGQAPEPSADENEPRSRAQEPDLDIDDIME